MSQTRLLFSANLRLLAPPRAHSHFPRLPSAYQPRLKTTHRHFILSAHSQKEDSAARRQIAQDERSSTADRAENIKPETMHKPQEQAENDEPKPDALLSEQSLSNKEQRKADWAIMKEMSRYLWPKVRLICRLLRWMPFLTCA